MSRTTRPLSQERIAPFDLEACVREAATLNQRALEVFTHPFPKAPDRWVSHDQFSPRPIEFTAEGEVEGGLSWLMGATIDLSFTRALFAPSYSKEGGHGYDPASAFFLEVASRVDGYPDSARFCADVHQQDKGRRAREIAGLHEAIPGEDDLSHFRRRVGAEAIEAALAVCVGLFRDCGLITGERLSTDGPLEPSYSRFKGCASFSQACQQLPLDAADRQELGRQLQGGAKRLERRCPFPEVVQKVLQATTKQGTPHEPTVALLQIEYLPADRAQTTGPQQLSELLSLPPDQLPPLRITWSHLTQGPQGELWGCCPQVPSALEARVGYHIDNNDPSKKARVFGSRQQQTTHMAIELGLEWPVGPSTYPATAAEGRHFPEHRAKVAIPFRAQQIELADAGDDAVEHDHRIRGRAGIPLSASNPRREDLSPEARVARGSETHGTPSAPCGRLCRSNGYDDPSESRQYVCGRPCPVPERERCPHGQKVRGSTHRMSFDEYPRLIGPMQRGTEPWKILYAARTASERTNSDDQEVIEHGRPPKLRGLQAFRFAGAIRTVAHVLRRALTCILDVTYTLGKLQPVTT
ncbi:MAG: hypothetical protein ACREOH_12250 [Candidatus Entotheonellia bacterium]